MSLRSEWARNNCCGLVNCALAKSRPRANNRCMSRFRPRLSLPRLRREPPSALDMFQLTKSWKTLSDLRNPIREQRRRIGLFSQRTSARTTSAPDSRAACRLSWTSRWPTPYPCHPGATPSRSSSNRLLPSPSGVMKLLTKPTTLPSAIATNAQPALRTRRTRGLSASTVTASAPAATAAISGAWSIVAAAMRTFIDFSPS